MMNGDQLSRWLEEYDRRMHTLEQYLWGPSPGKLGNQPIHYIGGVLPETLSVGGYPLYFDATIFEVRAMVIVPPTADCIVELKVLDVETQVLTTIGTITILAGEHATSLPLAHRVTNGDWATIYLSQGGGAAELTVSWRVM